MHIILNLLNKSMRLISNLITSFGISLCLILLIIIKKEKENVLIEKDKSTKSQINIFLNSID